MNDSPYSDALVEWVALAGCGLRYYEDAWVTETPGADLRCYLRTTNVHTFTQAERGDPESFLMSAIDMQDVERYLTWWFSFDIRSSKHLPFTYFAWKIEDIHPGWTVSQFEGIWVLHDPTGHDRARFDGDHAIAFSWIADTDLESLRDSFLNPDGLPLFPGLWIGPPRTP